MAGQPGEPHDQLPSCRAPLRSETGKLTVSELITESGLRRDIVYERPQLIDTFKARAKSRAGESAALTALAAERDELRGQIAAAREELAREQEKRRPCLTIPAHYGRAAEPPSLPLLAG